MRRLPLTWRLKAKYCRRESICRAMAPSTLSLFLTALMFAGVSGADKELGEVCATGEMCVHPSLELTCDAFAKKCLIQQDKACDGDGHKYLCVTGAECDGTSNKCACKSSVYTASGVTCTVAEDKYGGTCPTGGTCTGTNLVCANTFCGCTTGNKPKLSDGTCEANANEKVGQVCATDGSSGECGDPTSTFLSCPSSGTMTCTCNAGYAGPVGGTCVAIAPQKVGKVCTTGNAAEVTSCGPPATTNLECSSDACACKDGYYGVTGGDCDPAKGKLNGGCSATSECSVANTVCTGSTAVKKCVCKTGYSTDTAGTACAVTANAFGGSCTGGPTGKGTCVDANAKCSADTTGGICGCQDTHSGAIGASCVLKNTIGGACTGAADTKASCEDANALCTNSLCKCKAGYDGSAGGTCTKIADNKFGGSCTTGTPAKGTCEDTNAECTGGFCTCAIGYAGIAGSGCALPNKLGGSCTTMTKGTQGTCETAGATCSMQENGRCVGKSGAKAVVASVTSLVLACIVCLLAIN